jgi:predicted hotdog family 3-hydroxylacyl-ACP dehydratase
MSALPPIEVLLLHRGCMLLIDRMIAFDGHFAAAEFTPRAGAWYVDDRGAVPVWVGIEFMAQGVAAHVALAKRERGLPPKLGMLLGTKRYRAHRASFATEETLRIEVRELFLDESGLGAYECGIVAAGACAAEATLKVYEPADPGQLLSMQDNL